MNQYPPELKGGILIFFPSYTVMEDCIKRWKETGCWDKLKVRGSEESLVVEPRGSSNNNNSVRTSNNKNNHSDNNNNNNNSDSTVKKVSKVSFVNNSNSSRNRDAADDKDEAGGDGNNKSFGVTMTQLESALSRFGTCLLFAVCRGKVSEGIDFR